MSFYRTYRPQVIDEIDNAAVRDKLLSLLNKDKKDLPHAYLFTGQRGGGKTTAARIIAKVFNCTKPTKSGPCGKCDQCTSIADGSNLDVLEIDAASNRGIDEIRVLRDAINLAPASASYKVYIIDEVHMLTTEAFNALLKTLEEPPRHAVFVLATTDPQKVPITIRSRCIQFAFHKATTDELLHALSRVVKKEELSRVSDAALAIIATTADGSFRDAVKLLEHVSFHKGNISEDVARSYLSLTTERAVTDFVQLFLSKKTKESLAYIQELHDSGADIKNFLVSVLKELHRMLVEEVMGNETGWSSEEFQAAIRALSAAYAEMRSSPIASLPLELAVVEFGSVIPAKAGIQSSKTMDPWVKPEDDKKRESGDDNMLGLLTLEKLTEHWRDVIEAIKPYNHSVAGVLRSARPKDVKDGIVTIEAFYKFHQEKLAEARTRAALADLLKKLFGENVKVEVTLGTK